MLDSDFKNRWSELEAEFQNQASLDCSIYLPNLPPAGLVDHVFVAMEPSLGAWASDADEAKQKINLGFRNFVDSPEIFLFHYAIKKYLCRPGETYHITDLSKGAMLVVHAEKDRLQRYDRWFGALVKELELVSKPQTSRWAIGNTPAKYLNKRAHRGIEWVTDSAFLPFRDCLRLF